MPAEGIAEQQGFVESADGTKLAFRAWPKAGARTTFAVVHGLGEHAGRYQRFADGMAAHGMATYAVDLRGHGLSPGQRGYVDSWSQWTDDIAAFVAHVESVAGGEVVPLGHSFGGVAVLSAVLAGKLPRSRRVIVSNPALRTKVAVPGWKMNLGNFTSRVLPRVALPNGVDPGLVSRIPEVVEAYRTDPLVHNQISSRLGTEWLAASKYVLDHAGEIKLPFLILVGADDGLIDPEGSKEFQRRASGNAELKLLPGRYHEPFNDRDSEEVFAMIADWIAK